MEYDGFVLLDEEEQFELIWSKARILDNPYSKESNNLIMKLYDFYVELIFDNTGAVSNYRVF